MTDAVDERVRSGVETVHERIALACARVGRDPSEVRLVAVTKHHPPEAIRAAYGAGQREFGENYVQELGRKAAPLADLPGLRWHLIGHLQRNKVRDVVELGASVDTVDSVRLAEALARRAEVVGRQVEVLIQVNVAGEAQKSGCSPEELSALVRGVRALEPLVLTGLLTVPPATQDRESSRPHFARLRQLARAHGVAGLSMGMSHDLEVAVEEGATVVRVGTAIFGSRLG